MPGRPIRSDCTRAPSARLAHVKVEAARQRIMLEVAEVDGDLARVRHQRANLPEDRELAEIAERISAARDDATRADIAAEDLDREAGRLDSEINGMRTREEHDSELLNRSGMAPKALSELQHELAGLQRRRSIAEDEMIDLMEQQEAVAAERDRAQATVTSLEEESQGVRARRDAAAADLDEKTADLQQRRGAIVADAPGELLAVYDRQISHGKPGAGLLRQRRCGACRMELDRGTLSQLATLDEDDVARCEECGALLIRTHESGL